MKQKSVILIMAAVTLALSGCNGDRYIANDDHCNSEYIDQLSKNSKRDKLIKNCHFELYEVNDDNCKQAHYATLPENNRRDNLVEGCMMRSLRAPAKPYTPMTF